MPLSFPSHQGLIAPLWRRWPDRFNVLGLCIGAAAPDVVDGTAGIFRGGLGQWFGHSLFGLFLFCLPLGVALTWLVVVAGRGMLARARREAGGHEWCAWLGRHIEALNNTPADNSPFERFLFVCSSVWLGGFSHLVFDFVSHGYFLWLYPWATNFRVFPSWWYARWADIPLPGYKHPYPLGPHVLVWVFLSALGTAMLFWPLLRRRKRP